MSFLICDTDIPSAGLCRLCDSPPTPYHGNCWPEPSHSRPAGYCNIIVIIPSARKGNGSRGARPMAPKAVIDLWTPRLGLPDVPQTRRHLPYLQYDDVFVFSLND